DEMAEGVINAATGFEGKYLQCQSWDCESERSEGVAQREGIWEPFLKDVFVELQIDADTYLAGYESEKLLRSNPQTFGRQSIWDLLAASEKNTRYRQLAILAWGGYGKTTLLRHVAYSYGVEKEGLGKLPSTALRLIPVLLVLRKYSKVIAQENPPTLPELINEYHIPALPKCDQLKPVPPNWAKSMLQQGRGLIMLDGFDEVPKAERPIVAKWLTEQMRQYSSSVFVVTSRPKAYTEQPAADRLMMNVQLWVQPFDSTQRQRFIHNWYLAQEKTISNRDTPEVRKVAANAAQELIEQIEQEPELMKMAKNPLLLKMIATFHRLYPGAELPKRRVNLYEEICRLLLVDRPRVRRLDTVLLDCEPQSVLAQVAFAMMCRERQQVDGNVRIEASQLLEELAHALTAQGEAIEPAVFLQDVRDISELLVKQEDEYEFAHLSFQEYLAAAYIAAQPEAREPLLSAQLEKDWWKGTVLLYAGKTRKPARLIRALMQQGRTELAYECWQQTTRRVDEGLQAELEELQAVSEQVQDARYADLERYLRNGQWKEADNETYRLMITEVGKEEGQLFDPEDLLNFPCEPLKVIDGLWVKHSGGKFGFSVQKAMYLDCGGIPDGKCHGEAWNKLCVMNGWSVRIKFDIDSPKGHLPNLWFYGERVECISILFSRIQTCEL
ncbi:MAG: GUN4 domain-containing protein, partial [Phormidesmis sp.]